MSVLPSWVREGYVDATEPCTINVRKEDIEHSIPQDGSRCTLARCFCRALGAKEVYVFRGTAYVKFDSDSPALRFIVGAKALRDVIDPLDRGAKKQVKTGLYTLMPPPSSQRSGEAARRRERLATRRLKGEAPPAKKAPKGKKGTGQGSRSGVGRLSAAAAR